MPISWTRCSTVCSSKRSIHICCALTTFCLFFCLVAHRKTIYEYHRVTFTQQEIKNNTIIVLTALPTCLGYSDCQACINHNTTFEVRRRPLGPELTKPKLIYIPFIHTVHLVPHTESLLYK